MNSTDIISQTAEEKNPGMMQFNGLDVTPAAAKYLISYGWAVTPVDGKRPLLDGWETRKIEAEEINGLFLGRNLGIILGGMSTGLIDIDLDCPEAVTTAKFFLPETAQFGRQGNPGSHYIYHCPGIEKTRKFQCKESEKTTVIAEIRSNGGQTVFPPSIHTSGEPIRWEIDREPAKVSPEALTKAVAKTAAAALIARCWPGKGSRQDAAMALAGGLLTAGYGQDETSLFIEAVTNAGNDEEPESRLAVVKHTADKLKNRESVTGWPRLAELTDEKAVEKAKEWLAIRKEEQWPEPIPEGLPWPSPLAEEAFYGLPGEIVKRIEPHTEADPAALLFSVLVFFGNVIGRDSYFTAEADRHYCNLNIGIVGTSAKGRKGVSAGHIRQLFRSVDEAWEKGCIKSGLSSGEGLIWQVRDERRGQKTNKKTGEVEEYIIVDGVEDKRLVSLEGEFASILRVLAREGNTLSAVIRNAWDNGNLCTLTKNSPAEATDAHVSIIGHITKDELNRYLGTTEAGNGFGNRFLWVCAKRAKCLPEGGQFHKEDMSRVLNRLQQAVEFGRMPREIKKDADARELWHEIYPELSEGKPGLLGSMIARAEAQVMRIATIYALMDMSEVITLKHLKAALACWEYCEQSARFIFGDSLGDPLADEILKGLSETPEGLTRTEISGLFARHKNSLELNRALMMLTERGLAYSVKTTSENNRPVEVWHKN